MNSLAVVLDYSFLADHDQIVNLQNHADRLGGHSDGRHGHKNWLDNLFVVHVCDGALSDVDPSELLTITNMHDEQVVQPVLVSMSSIRMATETVRMILKIDDLVMVR
jgi:hypothetical protein